MRDKKRILNTLTLARVSLLATRAVLNYISRLIPPFNHFYLIYLLYLLAWYSLSRCMSYPKRFSADRLLGCRCRSWAGCPCRQWTDWSCSSRGSSWATRPSLGSGGLSSVRLSWSQYPERLRCLMLEHWPRSSPATSRYAWTVDNFSLFGQSPVVVGLDNNWYICFLYLCCRFIRG